MKELRKAQEELQASPLNMDLQHKEMEIYQQFKKSSFMEDMYLPQKSKTTWIRLVDDNTTYFHSVIKHRRLKQATTQIKDDQGNWQINPDGIAKIFVGYYKSLLDKNTTSRARYLDSFVKERHVLSPKQHVDYLNRIWGRMLNK